MNNYAVNVKVVAYVLLDIQANNEEEAITEASKLVEDLRMSEHEPEIEEIDYKINAYLYDENNN